MAQRRRSTSEKERAEPVSQGDWYTSVQYEVEVIIGARMRNGQWEYRIKWADWGEEWNTWEPLQNLQKCSVALDAFHAEAEEVGKAIHAEREEGYIVLASSAWIKKQQTKFQQSRASRAPKSEDPEISQLQAQLNHLEQTLKEFMEKDAKRSWKKRAKSFN
ncbi:hypothetical protein C8J56DRAFT_912399 [Mycena floridula]|nr:hypothetical protein C8J56DRAFT_912399 [Mycena floridula]